MLHYVSRAIGRTIKVHGLHVERIARQATNLPKRTYTHGQAGRALKSARFVERKTQKSAIESAKYPTHKELHVYNRSIFRRYDRHRLRTYNQHHNCGISVLKGRFDFRYYRVPSTRRYLHCDFFKFSNTVRYREPEGNRGRIYGLCPEP